MSTERHFGPEIVEHVEQGDVVRDVKAATALIVGTFPVHTVHTEEADRAKYGPTKSTLIRRRQDIAQHFGEHAEGYTIPMLLDAHFDQDFGPGCGTVEVVNVFDPERHVDGDGNPDPSQVTAADIIGAFAADGTPSGLKMAYASYLKFGWFPKFVGAPGLDDLAGVREELEVICNKVRARTYIDCPYGVTPQQVLAARGPTGSFDLQTDSRRTIPCYPRMASGTDDAPLIEPYAATMFGVHMASIIDKGYHHSPSNRRIFGRKPAQTIVYLPGQSDDDVQLLRGAGIVTTEERWGKGPRTSGNLSAAYPTDTSTLAYIHAQLTADVLHEGILFFLDEHKDRLTSAAGLTHIENVVNKWGRAKTKGADPELLGFRFFFDRSATTPEDIAAGHTRWGFDWMPMGVNEWITVTSRIVPELARDPLGLAAA